MKADAAEKAVNGRTQMQEAPTKVQQSVGGEQHDGEEDAADHEVEAFAVDQVDGEVLQQHEDDRADERADGVASCRRAPQ